jgi:glutamate--cysteine ligase catalytic subunit
MFAGDKILLDDSKSTDHFENIQSTNWQTVRFKPPPFSPASHADAKDAKAAAAAPAPAPAPATPASSSASSASAAPSSAASAAPAPNKGIGWRVEFRSMEVQLTDFENAAFTIFIAVLSRYASHRIASHRCVGCFVAWLIRRFADSLL